MSWKDLNMNEKAAYISIAIKNGLLDRELIIRSYNLFVEGGNLFSGEKNNHTLLMLVEPYLRVRPLYPHPELADGVEFIRDWNNSNTYYKNGDELNRPILNSGQFKIGGNLFGDGGDSSESDNNLWLLSPEMADWDNSVGGIASNAAIGMIPIAGTVNEFRQLVNEPSLAQLGWTGLSLLGDILTPFFGAGEAINTAGAAIKYGVRTGDLILAYKQYENAKRAAQTTRALEEVVSKAPSRQARRALLRSGEDVKLAENMVKDANRKKRATEASIEGVLYMLSNPE